MRPEQVTIIMATRGRRERAEAVLREVRHRPFIMVVDEGRREDAPQAPHELLGAQVIFSAAQPPSGPAAVEAGVLAATTPYLAILCDDVSFPDGGDAWLPEACRVYREQIGVRSGVVAINDGIRSDIACFPLLCRQFYLDHIYPTPYRRYYQDTEWSDKARALGVYAVASGARVLHENIGRHDGAALAREGEIYRERMKRFRGKAEIGKAES